MKKIIKYAAKGIRCGFIAILAVPAGILLFLMYFTWSVTDKFICLSEN